jgi:hypothetical protein
LNSVSFALAEPATPFTWPLSTDDLYWAAFRPSTYEIGMTTWAGEYLISVPASITQPAPDLVFWASEGIGASNILMIAEAKSPRTDPADRSHAPAWRRIFQPEPTIEQQETEAQTTLPERDVHAVLRVLVDWTRLTAEQLAEVLGASRRTMYNWLSGRPIRDEAQARILRFHDAVSSVAASRDAALVRDWLLRGDPPPALLAAEERWVEFETRVREETAPLLPVDADDERAIEARGDAPDVLRAALLAFSTASEQAGVRRADWRPREVTGISSDDEEDPE